MKGIYVARVGRVTTSAVVFIALLVGATTASSAERTLGISRAKGPDQDLERSIAAQVAASTDPLSATALASFRDLLETRGWPTFDAVGRDGIDNAGTLLLRASNDFDFQQQLLRLLDDRVGMDIDPLGYARLSDHIQIRHDQTQSYGTLMGLVDGGIAISPVLDGIGGARFFRDFYGLPSVEEQTASARSAYAAGQSLSDINGDPRLSADFKPYTQPAVRRRLGEMIAGDQATRAGLSTATGAAREKLLAEMREIDRKNIGEIKRIFDDVGFPDVRMVGRDGVSTAFLLVQHATDDPAFQRRALELARPLMDSRQMSRQQFAALTDRVLLAEGKQQYYGTQVEIVAGKAVATSLSDPDGVDSRRASMSMGPLADYLKILQERYGK